MSWPLIAGVCWGLFAALAFGLRSMVLYLRTGSFGFRLGSRKRVDRLAGMAVSLAMVAFTLSPVAERCGVVKPLPQFDSATLHWLGLLICICGVVATLWAQFSMGNSWRVGVDAGETTALVTHGPFRVVRNPIFSSLFLFATGGMLLLPNWLSFGAFVGLVLSLDFQVRFVEEPYLLSVHGDAYRAFASRVGRFVPFVGRLSR